MAKSKGKSALKKTGRALKSAARGLLASGAEILGAGASVLNPVRRRIRNKYVDLVIKGRAKKTKDGWQVGKKTFAQGRGTVNVSSGYYLDRHTGTVYAKRERNPKGPIPTPQTFDEYKILYEEFHRLKHTSDRSTAETALMKKIKTAMGRYEKSRPRAKNIEQGFYDASGFHPIRASSDYSEGQRPSRSKRAKAVKSKAKATASHKRKVSSRKRTTGRLASRSIKKTVKTRKRRNISQGFYDSSGFHPIRSASDYDPGTAGETGRASRKTRSKKKLSAKRKAAATARTRSRVRTRKATTSRLASRSLKRSAGLLKKRRNVTTNKSWRSVYLEEYESALDRFFPVAERVVKTGADLEQILSEAKRKKYRATVFIQGGGYPTKTEKVFDFTKKKNPSATEVRKKFSGSVSGSRDLFFPKGTPQGLAKLGKLVSITTEKGTIKPVHGSAWLCADTKEKLHIGATSDSPLFSGPARSFGKVTKVEYESSKPHLGYRGPIIWFHKLGEETGEKPTLHADGKGGLRFKGGRYRLTRRGIEN